eukprot:TRINITY_DN1777_c0_g1_i6.p2 TRINITY_DN1777_c0_g1~~TRINITY_DN1777_c0_g1_i6.p2  ORF type:complete len:154 (+),score=29.13 TRINITY_DN1777_c0_g1_i6:62-463(+)
MDAASMCWLSAPGTKSEALLRRLERRCTWGAWCASDGNSAEEDEDRLVSERVGDIGLSVSESPPEAEDMSAVVSSSSLVSFPSSNWADLPLSCVRARTFSCCFLGVRASSCVRRATSAHDFVGCACTEDVKLS